MKVTNVTHAEHACHHGMQEPMGHTARPFASRGDELAFWENFSPSFSPPIPQWFAWRTNPRCAHAMHTHNTCEILPITMDHFLQRSHATIARTALQAHPAAQMHVEQERMTQAAITAPREWGEY
jgi:hypothetical protein